MSCCGGRRPGVSVAPPRRSVVSSTVYPTVAVFRYEGEKPLLVVGRVTGAQYRFAGRGAEVAVDLRDRVSVRQVPRLRELRLA